jgi:uncharacterized membrane protein YdfJ with MMPL/SSD domain
LFKTHLGSAHSFAAMRSNRSSCQAQTSDGNLAARGGRWSAQHRKKAIAGWLVFVILAVVAAGSVGTQTFDENDDEVGESGRAGAAVSDHFPEKEDESVLVQSQNGARTDDAEFEQVVQTVVSRLENTQHVRNVQSPYAEDSQGALSEDGRSALVRSTFPPRTPTSWSRRWRPSRNSTGWMPGSGLSSSAAPAPTRH